MAHPKATMAPPANNGKRRPNRRQSMPASGETTVISTCRGADEVAHPAGQRNIGDAVVSAHHPVAAREPFVEDTEQPR
jgi:hypothetical protein